MCVFFLLLVSLLFSPQAAFAHTKSTSYSTWEITGTRAHVTVRVPIIELQRSLLSDAAASPTLLTDDGASAWQLATYLTTHLRLFSAEQPCQPLSAGVQVVATNDPLRIARTWTVVCPDPRQLHIRNDAFFATAPAHLHFARVRIDSAPVVEKLFAAHEREWFLSPAKTATTKIGSRFDEYLWLGVTHILSGADHLVFLLALLLLAESLSSVASIVTGFTIAHSVTLMLSVLNVVRPLSSVIESLIGFSIVVVALENVWVTSSESIRRGIVRLLLLILGGSMLTAHAGVLQLPQITLVGLALFSVAYLCLLRRVAQPQRLRWCVACIFGLIHGFGFAGVLTELALPTDRLVTALLGFNVGVELGQLGTVVLLWPLLRWVNQQRRPQIRLLTIHAGSAAILAVGICWFVTRAVAR
ncbi:MAG: HupE/UreJ family protein [Deltaproteobacteria bacterium]|nr:HupE/UreJ family protein [Deltaproteobacteria bacterium]